ncbi:uncharacterized protein LOC121969849 [Zingiber officinale]|uniref:Uncharacterized protein n=1 Tax=Zingiber officinale TaxID=94328 RepID=A0A8J5HZ40_ZINOF|nr:uncharacterized protein LOC121969849 [Zingiber officinale]KAG6532490.1 hypothetical protein ZIOFF_006336 [Zingiber officinale]
MAIATSFLPRSFLFPTTSILPKATVCNPRRLLQFPFPRSSSPKSRLLARATPTSGNPFDGFESERRPLKYSTKNAILLNLVQEIEPLELNLIQKDVPDNTINAIKRTISGVLGLLPSDQFLVLVEAYWEPIFKLLISSMKTGYALHNAEHRLCLERNLDIHEEYTKKEKKQTMEDDDSLEMSVDLPPTISNSLGRKGIFRDQEKISKVLSENTWVNDLRQLTPQVQEYIGYLQSHLHSAKKDLHELEKKYSELQMHEQKNELLDYLRSLQPEKVAELSEPTCPGTEEIFHSAVHGLLAALSPMIHSKPTLSQNPSCGTLDIGKDDYEELVENTFTRLQPLIKVPHDHLARLLFWCMLLGYYVRGLECRLELMEVLTHDSQIAGAAPQDGDPLV